VKEPIVYYVDRGAPEPVRSALIEGASWWAEAFDRAGFVDAYRVELMPEDAHPLDVRYNVIQWVHRSTRGWSYGGSITDPRTGEIIKGHVTLGSLRVRQDRLIFEGLAGVEATGSGRTDDPLELSLARLRQLSAHEVGHTLGFAHNFAASTYGDRASVMDYPAPLIDVTAAGELDFSRAYGRGIGAWDVHAVRYAYAQTRPGEREDEMLGAIIDEGLAAGLLFVSDADARPAGSAHPHAHLWDNGNDAVAGLRLTKRVRDIAIDRFGERNLHEGRPLALLQEVFVPLYLHHRYQVEAASKLVGGLDYRYAVNGDGQPAPAPLPAARQQAALDEVLSCLDPSFIAIPDHVRTRIAPRPFGYGTHRELFSGATSPAFDALSTEAMAADVVVTLLLEPHRCARLLAQHRDDPSALGLEGMLGQLLETVFDQPESSSRDTEIGRRVQQITVERMIALAERDSTTPAVRAIVDGWLGSLAVQLHAVESSSALEGAHHQALHRQIERHLDRQVAGERDRQRLEDAPPGSPIGGGMLDFWGDCSG
jgi:hypothetical protein